MKTQINLPIDQLADGSVQAKLNVELAKVFENIADVNTKYDAKRTVNMKLTFQPNTGRDEVSLDINFKTTLAPVDGVSTVVLTESSDGKVYASELKSGAKGQTYFDPEDGKLKTDKGMPVEEAEEQNNVVDLQESKN